MKCQLDCIVLVSCSSQKVTRLSTSEGFTHVLVIGEFAECPLGSFLILPFPLLLIPTYHYTQPGSHSWLKLVLPQSRLNNMGLCRGLTQMGMGGLLPVGLVHPHGTQQNDG